MEDRGGFFVPFLMHSCCLLFFLTHSQLAFSQNSACNLNDLRALRGFLFGLQSGIGDWSLNGSSADCCSWRGISCDHSVLYRRVIGLNLFNMSLKGSVSDSLASLDDLKVLNLSCNSLQGSVPAEIFHLAQLESLDLSMNSLSGFIPSNTSLLSIRVFNVSFNSFNGTHPVLSGSRNLAEFDVSGNGFWGPIDAGICSSSTQVRILRFSANSLSGNFPVGFGKCRSLRQLSLDMNRFSGGLPDDLFELSQLAQLNLQGNNLSGPVSSRISKLSNLVQLDLSLNSFSGSIDVITSLRKLESFSARSNRFDGSLPASLSNLSNLKVLGLWNNFLSGEIGVVAGLAKLTSLDLGFNFFAGPVPHNLSNCTKLITLNLARNRFSGEIPTSFMNLTQLAYLSLSNNSFSNLSSALGVLQHCPNLVNLVLTKNFQHGETMPSDGIQGFEKIEVLVIANCALYGSIPSWLANCPKLKVLDISWNLLDGTIPSWMGDFDHLFYLDISNNSLTGEIPGSLTRIRSLISVSALYQEDSIQEFPFFSKRNASAKGLQYNQASSFPPSLILSNNRLVGPILPGFGDLKELLVLDLHMNLLSGVIPDNLSEMSNLENLDLSHNNLAGIIPPSLTKLNFLSNFDVSYNNLVGQIPTGGQFSTFTRAHFAGNPGLCGFRLSPCSSEPPPEAGGAVSQRKKNAVAIGMAVGIGIGTVFLLAVIYFAMSRFQFRWQEGKTKVVAEAEEQLESAGSSLVLLFQNKDQSELTIDDILKSTNNFDQSHIIGCGGFGLVYKASLADGRKVAIKRLSGDFCQMEREFQAEVETLSRAQHRNLVLLQGYCKVGSVRLLIYSYMENGSLDHWLHEKLEEGSILTWARRLHIARGAARGLAYLHQSCEPRIVHRDIKSSNILLDRDFEAHLADFGLARLILPTDTHVTTDLVGTLGYIPPEYGQASVATYRGDVYSFGVVLLELLTGRRPVDMSKPKGRRDLIQWMFEMKKERREAEVFDRRIYDKEHDAQMMRVLEIACLCATRVMINALFMEVWYHKRSPEALQDVVTEYKLRLALETWEKSLELCEPEAVVVPLSAPHKGHPLLFNATALYRNARARLEVDLKAVQEALRYHDSYEVAAAMSNARDRVKRSSEMIKVIQECYNCIEIAVVQGVRWVARTSPTNWSVEHPLCGMDLMIILSLWLYRLEHDEDPATEEELAMYNKVRQLLVKDPEEETSQLSSVVARLWGSMLDEVVVWGITRLVGESFKLHSQALVGYVDEGEGSSNVSTPSMTSQGADEDSVY